MKLNCWEFKECGRQPQGKNSAELGVCPASTDPRLDGVHDGTNGGRACWVIAGTLCDGKVQGSFALKYNSCEMCDFYRETKYNERLTYQHSIDLLERLKNNENAPLK